MSYAANKRWRKKNPEKWLEWKNRYYNQFTVGAIHSNKRWTHEEEQLVLNHEISDRTISSKISRTVGAIQVKRSELKNKNVPVGGLIIK